MVDITNLCFVLVIYIYNILANDYNDYNLEGPLIDQLPTDPPYEEEEPKTRVPMTRPPGPALDYSEEYLKLKEQLPGNLGDFVKQLIESKKKKKGFNKKPETVYEPYWVGGEWVYYRTTRFLYKKRPKTTPKSNVSTTTTAPPNGRFSPTTPFVDYMCQHPCLSIYEEFGAVCGQRYNGIHYELKQFDDACDLFNENCENPYIKNRWDWYKGPWYILYRGPCFELTTPWTYPPTNVDALVSRNLLLVSKVAYNKDYSIFPDK